MIILKKDDNRRVLNIFKVCLGLFFAHRSVLFKQICSGFASKKPRKEVMLDLQSGNTHSYISYLKDIVDEECDLSVRAGVLMERLKAYEPNSENLTEKQKEVLGIWNNLSTNEQETVMSMLRGLRK